MRIAELPIRQLWVLVCLCLLAHSSQAQDEQTQDTQVLKNTTGPAQVVATLQNALIVNAENSSFEQRLNALLPIVSETHDFATIARLVTGRHWRKLSAEQQSEFIEIFTQLSAASYADNFKELGNSEFTYVKMLEQARNSQKVVTLFSLDEQASFVELSNKRELRFEYILQAPDKETISGGTNNDWRIINVIVDGISDLAIKRSNYSSTLSDQGFAALIKQIQQKLSDIRDDPSE